MQSNYRSKQLLPFLLVSAAAAVCSTAHAQARSESVALEEVIITAERREQSVQRSAIAVSVLGGDELVEHGIQSMRDILDSVPGLDLTQSTPSSNISLRGLGAGGGTNFTDGVVAFNVGGVPIARQYATIGAFYDLDRVEVLKGPQGTLYGRNATVGAINLVPKRPTQNFEGDFNLTLGNYNALVMSGAVSLPMTDTVAARIAFSTNRHDGYLSNGYNDASNHALRASLLFEPSDAFSLLLWADYYRDNSRGPSSINRYVTIGQEYQYPDNPWFAYEPVGCGNVAVCPTSMRRLIRCRWWVRMAFSKSRR
jgi:iron complex outermembrane receptor protein